ncbi:hypothetical protein L1887_19541 [Cichorium endivia]|nr:hypothetical protein L1887_19541 [Cichorium endivia]
MSPLMWRICKKPFVWTNSTHPRYCRSHYDSVSLPSGNFSLVQSNEVPSMKIDSFHPEAGDNISVYNPPPLNKLSTSISLAPQVYLTNQLIQHQLERFLLLSTTQLQSYFPNNNNQIPEPQREPQPEVQPPLQPEPQPRLQPPPQPEPQAYIPPSFGSEPHPVPQLDTQSDDVNKGERSYSHSEGEHTTKGEQLSDDEDVTPYDMNFLNDHTTPSASAISPSSSQNVPIIRKCLAPNQFQASSSKRSKGDLGNELFANEDIPRVVAKLQVSFQEDGDILKDQNKLKQNELMTKRSEDLIQDMLTHELLK